MKAFYEQTEQETINDNATAKEIIMGVTSFISEMVTAIVKSEEAKTTAHISNNNVRRDELALQTEEQKTEQAKYQTRQLELKLELARLGVKDEGF